MRSLISYFSILLCLLFPALAHALDLTRYLPLATGSRWVYKNDGNVTQTQTLGSPVVLSGGASAIPWTSADSNTTGNTTTYATVDSNGFRRYQEDINNVFVSGKGNITGTSTYSPPMAIAPAEVTIGSTYTSTGTMPATYTQTTTNMVLTIGLTSNYSVSTQIVGFETLANYDGTQSWSALKIISTIIYDNPDIHKSMTVTSWLVDGIGVVQTSKPNLSGIMETWKLVSYSGLVKATLNVVPGWNLIGNSINTPLNVAAILGDAAKVTTVWKWIPASSRWAFYTPSYADGGAAYAIAKGYDTFTTINGGEGFWVNAKIPFTVQLPAGAPIGTSYFQNQADPAQNKLINGWNLIAVNDNVTPAAFNKGLSAALPAQGVIPLNVTTLWTWDNAKSGWYFYAPSLDANGTLANYVITKNYLDFTATGKMLEPDIGFWVNKP